MTRNAKKRPNAQPHFGPGLFKFLRQLKRHNERDWFQANKKRFEEEARDPFLRFIEDFRPHLQRISPHFIADPRPTGGSLLRIYRDLRFRPDGDPYKTMMAARFPHAAWKQTTTPGLYLHLEPKMIFLGCGLWCPDPETRNRVREKIAENPERWLAIKRNKRLRSVSEFSSAAVKRMPPGYDPTHPCAEDLKLKSFITATYFQEDDVISADFLDRVVESVEANAPLIEFLTRALKLPWSSDDRPFVKEVMEIETPQFQ